MKEAILNAASTIARRSGLAAISRSAVAKRAGSADATVSYHYKSMTKLIDAVVTEAVRVTDLPIIADALMRKHKAVRSLPQDVKDQAAKLITL